MAKAHGEQSTEASFHRAYVNHMKKQLKDMYGLDEAKKDKLDKLGFKMMKNDPPVPAPKTPHPVPKGYKRVKDPWGFNVLKKIEEAVKRKKQTKKNWQAQAVKANKSKDPEKIRKALKAYAARNEEVANSVGGGMSPVIGGEGNIHGLDPIMGKPIRRRKFAGKQVFVVDPTTYHKAYLGKRKYEHYEKYLEGSPYFEEIRAYGRKHWDEAIILENEQTGAMVYLKYGRK
jgi:hypothetical protein